MKRCIGAMILLMVGCASSDPQPAAPQYPQAPQQSAASQNYEETMARVKANREAEAQSSAQLAADRQKEADERLAQIMAANAQAYRDRADQIQKKNESNPAYVARKQQEEQRMAEDEQCKATPGCDEAKTACIHFLQKKIAERNIYLEERNPAGVINLADLHDWGNMARAEDEMYQASRTAYEKASGKKFNAQQCGKLAE